MRMQFGVDDGDAFRERLAELSTGFAAWLDEHDLAGEPTSAELLMQYKWLAADGDLASWPLEQITEFLAEWCPQVMAEHRLPLRLVPLTVVVFAEYLDEQGLLAPTSPRPSAIRRRCTDFADTYDELEAGPVEPLLAEFESPPDPVRIPSPADRARCAAQAPILRDARALARWCGDRGRALTRTGNLRLADARHLVELLGTGDPLDRPAGSRLARSDQLRTLTWVLETAVRAGAVRRDGGRLVAVQRFAELDDTTAHEDLVLAARDEGVLTVLGDRRSDDDEWSGDLIDEGLDGLFDAADEPVDEVERHAIEILQAHLETVTGAGADHDDDQDALPHPADDATPAFLALLRHPADGLEFDTVAELLGLVLGWSEWFRVVDVVPTTTGVLVTRLERLGLVRWDDSEQLPDPGPFEETRRIGGRVVLTSGGIACALLVLAAEGIDFPTRPDPAVATAADVVGLAGEVPPDEWRDDIDAWYAAQPDPARAISAFVTEALDPARPLVVVLTATSVAAERFGSGVVDDLLLEHLDGPHRAQVARRLVGRGLLDPDELEPDLLLHASVDVLAVTIDTIAPDQWPELFAREFPPETAPVFEDLWRLDNPHLGDVLAELGTNHPDEGVAKAARRARMRWQSRTGGA
ncbi:MULTISPECIES: hypothetical protein [Pseudonocardia]|nr:MULTISPECIES: hypothetical protein [Pseudonocardia]TDN72528.1 hypothetical protein C8E95_1585 [Pseudonocardia autotrophica]